MDLSTKKIMLTGGAGFLGTFVVRKLKARGCLKRIGPDKGGHWQVIPRPKADK